MSHPSRSKRASRPMLFLDTEEGLAMIFRAPRFSSSASTTESLYRPWRRLAERMRNQEQSTSCSAKAPHDAERNARVMLDVCRSGRLRDRLVPEVGAREECRGVVDEQAAAERLAHPYVQSAAEGQAQANVAMRVVVVDGRGLRKP